jgi:competence protein ComEC
MQLTHEHLFETKKEWGLFFLAVTLLFSFSLLFEYYTYSQYKKEKAIFVDATLRTFYAKVSKKGKPYRMLYFKSDNGLRFKTLYYGKKELIQGKRVHLKLYTKHFRFEEYLKERLFGYSKIIHWYDQPILQYALAEHVKAQHEHEAVRSIFSALFFATPISYEARQMLTHFGINHLLALSGYHLGLLSAILFFLLKPIYWYTLQRKYPFLHLYRDVGIVVIGLLFTYMALLDFTPSLLRSFTLMFIGFILYDRGFKILSFVNLGVVVLLLLALFPKLIFSLAFWLSVGGTYYIFLYLHHFQKLKVWIAFFALHFFIFAMMVPIVHYFFEPFTLEHLISPFLTMIFSFFYPIALGLHLIGQGSWLESVVLWFMYYEFNYIWHISIPFWGLVIHIVGSLLAIRWRTWIGLLLLFDLFLMVQNFT